MPTLPPLLLALVLLLLPASATAGDPGTLVRVLPAHPGRIVVRYRPRVDACAHCLLAHRTPFASVTGTNTLDRLHRELRVRNTRSLFLAHHGPGRSAAWRDTVERARKRFPARQPSGAVLPDLSGVYVLELPAGADVAAAAARYAADPDVEYAHPDYDVAADLTPDDPFFASSGTWGQSYLDLWGLHTIQAATAWDTARGQGTVVAVIDTGVDQNHPDLAANLWTNPGEIASNGIDDDGNGFVDDTRGWDFVGDDNTPDDLHGHGTHVAGTAAAVGNNGAGVVGVAWDARIMAVRGLDAEGAGLASDLAAAILYAAENGADVLNNSWGGRIPNAFLGIPDALSDAVATASGLGAVVIASAGNSSDRVDYYEPAGIPQVIAIGASTSTDGHASFSNSGDALSVAAPGVDVLSLRSAVSPVTESGNTVGSDYLRLSGTSMAAPHASGLAAVLLSSLPQLTPDEVRWHLELNADQPGYPGWEGQAWNPYFGWGRIDAARVFDPPAVTTRLRAPEIDLHAFAGSAIPDVAQAKLSFSTHDPVAWSASGPPWLAPSPAQGTGPDTIGLSLDATGLAPGPYTGTIDVSAPAAIDGGVSRGATLQLHRDERVGDVMLVSNTYRDSVLPPRPPHVLGDGGAGVLAAWSGNEQPALLLARVDAGGVSGPYALFPGEYKEQVTLAFDGQNYLVLWRETDQTSTSPYGAEKSLLALRVTPAGTPLDSAPIVLRSRTDRGSLGMFPIGVGFDGTAYTVFWSEFSYRTDRGKVYVLRVGTDGVPRSRRRKVYPRRQTKVGSKSWAIYPRIACASGTCLLAWDWRDGEISAEGAYVDKVYGVRLAGDRVLDAAPFRIVAADLLTAMATDGQDYLVTADRHVVCAGPTLCGVDTIATRVTGAGLALDPGGIRVNVGPTLDAVFSRSGGLTFDGTNWVATFVGGGSGGEVEVFAARIAPDGHVLDDEPQGLLVHVGQPGPSRALRSTVAATATDSVVFWADTIFVTPGDFATVTTPIYAQRVLPLN